MAQGLESVSAKFYFLQKGNVADYSSVMELSDKECKIAVFVGYPLVTKPKTSLKRWRNYLFFSRNLSFYLVHDKSIIPMK